MDYETIELNQGYLRKIELDACSWYRADDACDLLGVIDNKAAIARVPDNDKLILKDVPHVNINGFELINEIGRSDRHKLTLIWLNPNIDKMEMN